MIALHEALQHSSITMPHGASVLVLIVLFAVLFRASSR